MRTRKTVHVETPSISQEIAACIQQRRSNHPEKTKGKSDAEVLKDITRIRRRLKMPQL